MENKRTIAMEVNGQTFVGIKEHEGYFACPFNGCEGACPYWVVLEGYEEIYCCDKETILNYCESVK